MPEQYCVAAGAQADRHVAGRARERRPHERDDRGAERADQCESTEGGEHRAGALKSEHAEHHGDAVHQLGVGLGHGVSLEGLAHAAARPIYMAKRHPLASARSRRSIHDVHGT